MSLPPSDLDLDDATPADVGRRLVEIHVMLERLADEAAALELESHRLKALLITALPPDEAKLLLVASYRDGTIGCDRHDPHLVELFREEGQDCVEMLKVDRWADLAWPESRKPAAKATADFPLPLPGFDRLAIDLDVSVDSPVVKGTWVTVRHVVSLIVDGWTWSDILQTHPELTEDDIRSCLAYSIAREDAPKPEVGSNAALIAAANGFRPAPSSEMELIDSETA